MRKFRFIALDVLGLAFVYTLISTGVIIWIGLCFAAIYYSYLLNPFFSVFVFTVVISLNIALLQVLDDRGYL